MGNIHVLTAVRILSAVIAVTLWSCEVAVEKKNISFEVQQITSGPKHHLFGYVGHAVTIPWNQSGRYIVSLRTDFYKRMPRKGETAEIVIIDTKNKFEVTVLDKTLAWNLQQGTMLYWNPNAPETQFFFNDIDPKTGAVFTVLYDISKHRRLREYRYGDESIANGGVAPGGKYFAGINYGKISRLREVISYAGAKDSTLSGPANPDTDGLFKVDIATGTRQLLVSYKTLAKFLGIKSNENYPIYVHHTLWNRNSDRIIFIVRGGGKKGKRNKWPNVGCVISSDGSHLGRIDYDGHPEWYEGNLLTLPNKKKGFFKLYDVDTKKVVSKIGEEGVFPSPGGDNAYSPDGKWYVGSHKKERKRTYTFYRFADKAHFNSPPISTKPGGGVTRIDGAPRWNRTSDAILVGGVAEDGSRQLSVVRMLPTK